MSYDNACKYLSEQYPSEFVRWLLAREPQQVEVLKTELTLPEFDVRKPAKNEYSKGLEAFLERAYILNKP